jgi:membrane protease YdiL (CAAX protease family)
MLGPSIAAFLVVRHQGSGLRSFLRQTFSVRGLRPHWLLIGALLPAVMLSAGLWVMGELGRTGPISYTPTLGAALGGLVIAVVEELGWRGCAFPRLEAKWGPLAASGVLGVLWTFWHVPMFIGQHIPLNLLPIMLLFFVGASLWITALGQRCGAMFWLAVACHWGAHLNNSHRALPGDLVPLLLHAIIYAALGVFALVGGLLVRSRKTARAM